MSAGLKKYTEFNFVDWLTALHFTATGALLAAKDAYKFCR
jgi:hypothetical protein